MEFFQTTDITAGQAEIIARGMLAVARAEGGLRKAELALIQAFYCEVAGSDAGKLAALEKARDLTPEVAATGLTAEPLAKLFLKSCILAGYADGNYTPEERAVVDSFAKALHVDAAPLAALEQSVKEYLVSQLAGLSNVEATVAVARKLKI